MGGKVLVIEREGRVRKDMVYFLGELGLDSAVAYDRNSALRVYDDLMKNGGVYAIIIDPSLEDIDHYLSKDNPLWRSGLEVLAKMKKMSGRLPPVIFHAYKEDPPLSDFDAVRRFFAEVESAETVEKGRSYEIADVLISMMHYENLKEA